MGSYETTIDTLAGELTRIEAVFRGLTGPEWDTSTLLVPVDPDLPHWTVFELAGHFDISIGLTRMLIDGRGDLQPARDRPSFFITPRSATGLADDLAWVLAASGRAEHPDNRLPLIG